MTTRWGDPGYDVSPITPPAPPPTAGSSSGTVTGGPVSTPVTGIVPGGSLSYTFEHPIGWGQLRKYFDKSMGVDESKKLISMLEENNKALEDFIDVAFLKTNGGTVDGYVRFKGVVEFTNLVVNVPPTGSLMPYAGAAAPTGWFLADGTEKAIASYTTLYNVLTSNGTVFPYGANTNGSGAAGSTHFRVPNLRGRVPVGVSSDAEFDTLGETGGEKAVTLDSNQMPSHAHTVIGSNQNPAGGTNPFGLGMLSLTDVGYNYTTTIAGSGLPHNNLQPYIALNYIIKY